MTSEEYTDPRVCRTCRVITVQDEDGDWIHPAPLRIKFGATGVCASPIPGEPPRGAERRFGRARIPSGEKYAYLDRLFDAPLLDAPKVVLGTDGAFKMEITRSQRVRKQVSWGYIATTGAFGMGCSAPSGDIVGDQRPLVAELRAVFWGLQAIPDDKPVILWTDSQDTVRLINEWRGGGTRMPRGYSLVRQGGRSPRLLQLAKLVHERGDSLFPVWVPGHQGVALNEGADALSKLARAWASDRIDRATAVADGRNAASVALRRHFATELHGTCHGPLTWDS